MTLSRFLVFAPLFIMAFPATAQMQGQVTAMELQSLCTSRYDIDAGMCAGYIKAIAEELMHEHDPRAQICLSPAISAQTLMENVLRAWAEKAPEPQDLANDSVAGVLKDRFRCI
jgi:Rap1a immunity proteins